MLKNIEIRNLVLIKAIYINFNKDFTVITGDTGTGKSSLLQAIDLVAGKRFEERLIRTNSDKSTIIAHLDFTSITDQVEAIFQEHEIEYEDLANIQIKRVMKRGVSSKIWIEGEAVNLKVLDTLGKLWYEKHSQHDTFNFAQDANILPLIDSYNPQLDKLDLLQAAYQNVRNIKNQIKAISLNEDEKERIIQDLKELEALELEADEEETLNERRAKIKKQAHILKFIRDTGQNLVDSKGSTGMSANDLILASLKVVEHSEYFNSPNDYDSEIVDYVKQLDKNLSNCIDQLHLAVEQLHGLRDCVDFDEYELENIESRLFQIQDMARKHRVNSAELYDYYISLKEQSEILLDHAASVKTLQSKFYAAKIQYNKIAEVVSKRRNRAGKQLATAINQILPKLKLDNAEIQFENEVDKAKITTLGYDQPYFLIRTNLNAEFQPLGKIASGGELSRIMLAIKVALSQQQDSTSLVLDEIDSGIGGSTAFAMAQQMQELSKHIQLICISHAPQIAALADHHLYIDKKIQDDLAVSVAKYLQKQSRVDEIARMLSGNKITEEALQAAQNLLDQK